MLDGRHTLENATRVDLPVIPPEPLLLKTPGIMSSAELAAWAQVGKNTIAQVVALFHVRELTGNAKNHRYSTSDVFRRLLGVTPTTPEEFATLLIPLQKVSWVSQMTGISVSTISAAACGKRGGLPLPVELTVTGPNQAPARSRRWIPAQVEAYLRGEPIPFLANNFTVQNAPVQLLRNPSRNVFAAICATNAEVSRQFQS